MMTVILVLFWSPALALGSHKCSIGCLSGVRWSWRCRWSSKRLLRWLEGVGGGWPVISVVDIFSRIIIIVDVWIGRVWWRRVASKIRDIRRIFDITRWRLQAWLVLMSRQFRRFIGSLFGALFILASRTRPAPCRWFTSVWIYLWISTQQSWVYISTLAIKNTFRRFHAKVFEHTFAFIVKGCIVSIFYDWSTQATLWAFLLGWQ